MELTLAIVISLMTFIISLIALGLSIYSLLVNRPVQANDQIAPVAMSLDELSENLFGQEQALKKAKEISAEELV